MRRPTLPDLQLRARPRRVGDPLGAGRPTWPHRPAVSVLPMAPSGKPASRLVHAGTAQLRLIHGRHLGGGASPREPWPPQQSVRGSAQPRRGSRCRRRSLGDPAAWRSPTGSSTAQPRKSACSRLHNNGLHQTALRAAGEPQVLCGRNSTRGMPTVTVTHGRISVPPGRAPRLAHRSLRVASS